MNAAQSRLYTVAVNYGVTTAGPILAAFEQVDPEFFEVSDWGRSDICAGLPEQGTSNVQLELISYPESTPAVEALEDLSRKGYRPATFEELIAFVSAHPDEVSREPIAAPGTRGVWKGFIPCHAFVFLEDGKRHVTVADEWGGVTRYLAVRTFRVVS